MEIPLLIFLNFHLASKICPGGIATDCSLFIPPVQVQNPGGACKKVTSNLGLVGVFCRVLRLLRFLSRLSRFNLNMAKK